MTNTTTTFILFLFFLMVLMTSLFIPLTHHQAAPRIPVWFMRQAGRYMPQYRAVRAQFPSFMDVCFDTDAVVEITMQPIKHFGFDAAILFSDILVIPHLLGQEILFKPGIGPTCTPITLEMIPSMQSSLDGLITRSKPIYEAITRLRAALPQETSLIGFAGAPWTVLTYMFEGGSSKQFDRVKQEAWLDSPLFQSAMDLIVEATILHLTQQIKSGAQIIQLFDSWSGSVPYGLLPSCVLAPTKRIIDALHGAFPDVPIIAFPKGIGPHAGLYHRKTGCDALACDHMMAPEKMRELQQDLPVQGNLDPAILLTNKTVIEQQIQHILDACGTGAFIFNLGHGILPHTPMDHVAYAVELIHQWRPQ